MERLRKWGRNAGVRSEWPLLCLLAAMAISAALVMWEGRHLTFFNDEWDLILHRRGHSPSVFLSPKNGHLVLVPLLIYKTMLAIFGASYTPLRASSVALSLVCAGLLFVFVRRRAGDAPALAAAVVLLFLGVAWEQLLWALGITYYCALAGGLAMLLALDRGDRRGDLLACGLLVVAEASFSIGLAFAVAAVVEICFTSVGRRWRRLWIPAVPLALYGLWSLKYGESQVETSDIASTPFYIAESASAAMSSLTGLFRSVGTAPGAVTGFPPFNIEYGQPLAAIAAIILFVRLGRTERANPRLWTLAALALTLWTSFALVAGPGRSPGASRYQYPNVLLVLLLASELAIGVVLTLRARLLLAGLVAFSLVANIANLRDGARFLEKQSEINRAELAGLELSRSVATPTFRPEGPESYPPALEHYMQFVDARAYFGFISKFGSPADSRAELAAGSEIAREAADIVMVRGKMIGAAAVGPPASRLVSGGGPLQAEAASGAGAVRSAGVCLTLAPGSGTASVVLTVPAQGLWFGFPAGGTAAVKLRRYGHAFVASAGGIPPGTSLLVPAPDASSKPWQALVTEGVKPLRVCAEG